MSLGCKGGRLCHWVVRVAGLCHWVAKVASCASGLSGWQVVSLGCQSCRLCLWVVRVAGYVSGLPG